ncbi:MAG: hypothetical protein KIS85_08665 [Anaerolineales bacterium]|nr:hypothetical protein [Anaerolineales bacterium]
MQVKEQLRFLQDGLAELKDYLLSGELFWNIGGNQQLTVGNLLLAEAFLRGADQLPAEDAKQLAALQKEWRSAWDKKANREFTSRLRQWTHYLRELGDRPPQHADYYPSEVRLRALLELLAQTAEHREQLAAADSVLRSLTAASDFVWGQAAAASFPSNKYWFLYRRPIPAGGS